jgi:hypothetical protein
MVMDRRATPMASKREMKPRGPAPEETATLREPAAPRVTREARAASEALLREILVEGPAGTTEPELARPSASSYEEEEDDWPSELHPLHFHGD